VASTQPRKQRKYRHNAPLHVRRKFLSAHLSRELRKEFGKRSVPLRKGDEVTVMKGGFRGFKGSVERVDMSSSRVYVDGMKRKKVDGSEIAVPVHASNVMITKLTLEDKMRQAVFERAAPKAQKPAKPQAQEKKESKPKAQKEAAETEGVKRRLPAKIRVKKEKGKESE